MFDNKPVISPASLRCDTVVSPSVDVAAMIEAYELSRCQGCEPAVIRMDEFPQPNLTLRQVTEAYAFHRELQGVIYDIVSAARSE